MLAMANTLNKKMEIVDNCSCDNINGKFIIKDEFTYILSLLICGNIVLLEKKNQMYLLNILMFLKAKIIIL